MSLVEKGLLQGLTLRISSSMVSRENGARDQGCKRLCKVESDRVERIELYNSPNIDVNLLHKVEIGI